MYAHAVGQSDADVLAPLDGRCACWRVVSRPFEDFRVNEEDIFAIEREFEQPAAKEDAVDVGEVLADLAERATLGQAVGILEDDLGVV